ncbi:MAG: hypothetical protein QMD95_04630 [Candidatus Hodarchaeaceae archaeon]|nr:hypothetical protein [Candidatus Hodarchaeaceae archaeon]
MPWLFRRRKKLQTFTLDLNPVMGTIAPGGSASASITVGSSSREGAAVTLQAGTTAEGGGPPAGINVSFNPQLGVAPFSSVMNVSTSLEFAPGVYPFLVIATGKDMKLMATYTLIVRLEKTATKGPEAVGGEERIGEETE